MADLATQSHRHHDPEISALRGLAILIVVGGHFVQRIERFNPPDLDPDWKIRLLIDSFASPAGGVYLFFTISGYLIAQSVSRMLPFNLVGLRRFNLRRILRITPPYFVVLVSTWLVLTICAWEPPRTHLFNVRPTSLLDSLLASLSYVHGVAFGTYPRLFPPGWTLEVEVQFYVLAPFLCLLFDHLALRFGLGAASAIALGTAGAVALASLRSGIDQFQPTILVYLPLFLLGIVAYHVRQGGWRPVSRHMPALGWVALLAFVTSQPWLNGLVIEIAARMAFIAVMFSAVAAGRGAFCHLCQHAILVRILVASFSVYLVHLQIIHLVAALVSRYAGDLPLGAIVALNLTISAALIYGAARLFFRKVERPAHLFSELVVSHDRHVIRDASR